MTVDPELTAKNIASVNEQFYDASPWTYFQQRLAHLVLVASNDDRFTEMLAAGATAGGVTLKIKADPEPKTYPTAAQASSFTHMPNLIPALRSAWRGCITQQRR